MDNVIDRNKAVPLYLQLEKIILDNIKDVNRKYSYGRPLKFRKHT